MCHVKHIIKGVSLSVYSLTLMQGISLKKQTMSSAYPSLLNDTEICSLSLFTSTEDET
jgi:hypothetical protein